MKSFKVIIAIFGVLLLLVCANAQGNPSLRPNQEMCFVSDVSPPPAQIMAVLPEFGQSIQAERGVSVPIVFSTGNSENRFKESFRKADSRFNVKYPGVRYASDLGDRYAPQINIYTRYNCQPSCKRSLVYIQYISYYRAREKL